jgi:hypothetical protein
MAAPRAALISDAKVFAASSRALVFIREFKLMMPRIVTIMAIVTTTMSSTKVKAFDFWGRDFTPLLSLRTQGVISGSYLY